MARTRVFISCVVTPSFAFFSISYATVRAYSGVELDFNALTIIFSGTNSSLRPSRFFTIIIPGHLVYLDKEPPAHEIIGKEVPSRIAPFAGNRRNGQKCSPRYQSFFVERMRRNPVPLSLSFFTRSNASIFRSRKKISESFFLFSPECLDPILELPAVFNLFRG
jgi:hypothetical protein